MQKIKNNIIYVPFLLTFIILLFQYSHIFPQGDDFAFYNKGGSLEKIWELYAYNYFYIGSRFANSISQLFLIWDLNVWKVATPITITSISLLLFYYCKGSFISNNYDNSENLLNDFSLAAVCSVLPGLIPLAGNMLGDTFFWLSGACNYIYPFLFILIGFIPIYNLIRYRETPKIFVYVSPLCFLFAGIMHEQISTLLCGMCVVTFIYLKKANKLTKSFFIYCVLSILVVIFTFTCPGIYNRFTNSGNSVGLHGISRVILHNIPIYFGAIFNSYLLWIVFLGVCSLFLITAFKNKTKIFLTIYLIFGIVYYAFSNSLNLPQIVTNPELIKSTYSLFFEIILIIYWLLYISICFTVSILAARKNLNYMYIPILFVGMFASQAIPILTGAWGRPLIFFILFDFLILITLSCEIKNINFDLLKLAIATIGICSMILTLSNVSTNYKSYQNLVNKVIEVKNGKSDTLVIDYKQFKTSYFYFNAFSKAWYDDIKQYYKLPSDTKIINK